MKTFKNEELAIQWIIEYKDMFHPYKFLRSAIECGYITIVA